MRSCLCGASLFVKLLNRGRGESWAENQMALEINVARPVHASNWSALEYFGQGKSFHFLKIHSSLSTMWLFYRKGYILGGLHKEAENSAFFPPVRNTDFAASFLMFDQETSAEFL